MLIKKLLLISTVCPLILSVVAAQEPSGAFTGRGLDNVAAFARLVGYVRYFYAGDAAAATDWDAFTIRYIQNIETASTPVELAQMLSELFTPRAPLIQVFPSGDQPRPISDFNLPADRMQFVTMWVHVPMGDPRVPPFGMLPGERIQVPLGTTSLSYADALYLHYANKQADILVNDPLSPIVVDLGGGVSAAIPLAVYSDDT
ncbi:MAG: hypothetical protein JNJ61_16535, partial [Anaerolineae bacterium]|nr:hypothetical protein [Anaerolineae bacterium]